ncbi:hypothetical protein FC697_13465, partial [Bacillus wiedmannii]|uniref:ATP-binding protein n=1 Tax=Bacillus wiedmannii TaxID=1890302 RepID=UPI00113ECA8C
ILKQAKVYMFSLTFIAATIITSNLSFDRWEEVFHDPVLTAVLTDRLTHRAHVINMIGGSYRILETKEWIEKSNY